MSIFRPINISGQMSVGPRTLENWRQVGPVWRASIKFQRDPLEWLAQERAAAMRIKRETGRWRGKGVEQVHAQALRRVAQPVLHTLALHEASIRTVAAFKHIHVAEAI